jgi:hypothetical protein
MDLELCNLTVEVPRHEALIQQFHTVHLRFDAAPAVLAGPSSPDGSTEALRCAQGLVAGDCPGVSGLQGLAFLRGGIIAKAPRAAMVRRGTVAPVGPRKPPKRWHLRVSKAPSAVTRPIP